MISFWTSVAPFVDAQRPDFPVEVLGHRTTPTPRPPNICTARSITRCAPSVAVIFVIAAGGSILLRSPIGDTLVAFALPQQ
jgi:hypothetical protein